MDVQRQAGNELLAISHNANLSDGIMFPLEVDNKGRPIDTSWAQQRVNHEPLSEIQQLKGASETHPLLSPNDEFAGHEILTYLLGGVERAPKIHGSYIREAYQNGLAMQETRGYNPYKFGVVGASDSYNTAVPYTELHSGELGSPALYEIRDGRIVTTLGTMPLDVTVYKVGDNYVAARSNEFGYANYELQRSE